MSKKLQIASLMWRITCAHVIAYFIAGIFALVVMDYKTLYETDSLSLFMLPTTHPMVALGPSLQVFRGILLSLAIYPVRKTFFEEAHGYAKLGLMVLVFSLLSTIGPTMGSIDGYIYTTIPVAYQLLGYPEALIYILLFVGMLKISNKYAHKKITTIVPSICVVIIVLLGVMGFLFTNA